MPYASEQLYVTWGGYIGQESGGDIWQCGLHYAPITPGGIVGPPNEDQAEAFFNAVHAFHTNSGSAISAGALLGWVKIAHLDTAGEYTTDPVVYEDPESSSPGNATDPVLPPQVAMAVTLWSGQTLGKANYGRFYVPMFAAPMTGYRFVTQTFVDSLGTNARELLADGYEAINDNSTSGGLLDVTNMSQVGTGTNKRVTQIRVGNVKDTQRRRRNRIAETYTTFAR